MKQRRVDVHWVPLTTSKKMQRICSSAPYSRVLVVTEAGSSVISVTFSYCQKICSRKLNNVKIQYIKKSVVPYGMRCFTLYLYFGRNVYRHAYLFLGKLLHLTHEFPKPCELFSGAVWTAFYMVTQHQGESPTLSFSPTPNTVATTQGGSEQC